MINSFKNKRYITRGIQSSLPFEIQLLFWNMIDTMNVKEKDYLQIFNVKIIDKKSKLVEIEHSQEIPKYTKKINLTLNIDRNIKVFCIDDVTHSTMLLAEEY